MSVDLVRLEDVTTLISRGRAPKYCEVNGLRVLNQKCIRDGKIEFAHARMTDVSAKPCPGWAYLQMGDCLINSTGSGTLGRTAIVNSLSTPATVDTHVTIVRPQLASCFPPYLAYYLRSIEHELILLSEGATGQTELARDVVKNLVVPLPPLAEQQRIVAKLDEVMALGYLIQDRSALERARSEELRQRMTVELMESSGPLIALGGLCEVLDSKRKPITKKDRAPGPIPYYGATGVVDYVRDFIFDEDLVLLGEDGAKWGAGDKSAFGISGRTWVNNHAHVLRPDRKVVRDQWLIEYLNAVDLGDYVTGLTVPKLNQAQMRSIPVPVPTLAVQDELLSRLDAVFELSGRLGEIAATRKAIAGELRQSVLAAAFRGDL